MTREHVTNLSNPVADHARRVRVANVYPALFDNGCPVKKKKENRNPVTSVTMHSASTLTSDPRFPPFHSPIKPPLLQNTATGPSLPIVKQSLNFYPAPCVTASHSFHKKPFSGILTSPKSTPPLARRWLVATPNMLRFSRCGREGRSRKG